MGKYHITKMFASKIVVFDQVVQLPAGLVTDLAVAVGSIQKIKDICVFIFESWM